MYPLVLGVITTYQCPLECQHCCFSCGPRRRERIAIDDVRNAIDVLHVHSGLRCVAFTGGEPLLLGKDLHDLIAHINAHGLSTRVVTSGFWGKRQQVVEDVLEDFCEAGLKELNISTGDYHSRFVPVEQVCSIASAATRRGLRVIVVVEHQEGSLVTKETVKQGIEECSKSHKPVSPVIIIENHLVPKMPVVCDPTLIHRTQTEYHGCPNILRNLSLTPLGELYACCGLTMCEIPELRIGTVADLVAVRSPDMLHDLLFSNGIYALLATEGPKRLAHLVEDEIGVPVLRDATVHRCEECAALFAHGLARPILREKAYNNVSLAALRLLQQEHLICEYCV